MNFHSRAPGPPLDQLVDSLWFYSGLEPDHSIEKVLPHGGVEIVIDLQERPRRLHDRERLDQIRWYRESWISGLHTEHIVIGADPDSSMMGVRFRPGGAAPFLGLPACELARQVVELELVWGHRASDLRGALLEAPAPGDKLRILESFLLRACTDRPALHPTVAEALRRLQRPGPLAVRDLAAQLGVSQKHLIHLFLRHVGLRPKEMQRVLRFEQALKQIARGWRVSWADLAQDCGYYDQAHFANEFRAFSGMRPTHYETDERKVLYFVPIDGREREA